MSDSEDKKRNKLGYQRISIACAHCRRRKIRCLLAENDPQERCQNCIRLKKECVFYPVDQQQALDNRSQSAARSGTASVQSSGVSPSPPELASGRPFERTRQFGSYPSLPSLPSNAPPGFGMPIGSGAPVPGQGEYISGFPPHGVHGPEGMGPPVEYGFQQAPVDSQRAWEQSASMSSPNAPLNRARDSMQPQYWRSSPTGTVPSADFAPFPSNSNASVMSDGSFAYPVPNSQGWHSSQNARSVSYGQLPDGASHGYIPPSAGYPPQPAQEVQPIHPATAASSQTSTHTAPPIHNSAPGGTPIMPLGQPSPFMFQSQGSVSASPIPGQLPYAGHWYADHSPYGVDEQDLRSPTDQRPFTKAIYS